MKIIGIVSLFVVIGGQSDDYVATWSSAHLQCAERGGLFVNHGASLEHLRGVISTTPIWLGGRRTHTSWAWADGKPLYEAQGCFKRPPNLNLQYDGITEVFDCFLSCKSVYKYGIISGDRCTCIDYIGNLSRAGQDSCNQPCARNFGETCGGHGFISIYQRSTADFPFYSELSNTDFSDCGYLSEDRNQIVIKTDSCGNDITEFKPAFCKDPGRTIEPEKNYQTWESSCQGSTKAHVTRADNPYLTPPKYFWIGLNRTTTWIWDDGISADPEVGTIKYGEKRGGCLAAYEDEAKKIYLTALPCKTKHKVVCVHGVPPHVSTSTPQMVTSLKETTRTASTEETTLTTKSTREPTPTITKYKSSISPSTISPASHVTTTSLPSTTVKTTTFEQTTKTTTLKETMPTTTSPTFKTTTTKAPTTDETTVLITTSTTSKPTTTSTTTFTPTPTTTTPTTRLPTSTTKHPTRTTRRPPTTTEPSTPTTAQSTTTLKITKSTLQPSTTLKTITTTLKSSTTSYTTHRHLTSPTKQSNKGHNNEPTTSKSLDTTSQRVTSFLHPLLRSTDKRYGLNVDESTVSTGFLPSVGQTSSSTNTMTGQRLQVTPTENNQGLQPHGLYIGLGVAGGVVLLILLIIILGVITRTRGGQSKIYRVLLRSRRSLSQHSNSSTASKDNLVDKSFWGKTAKRVKLQSVTTDDRIIKWRDDNWGFEMEDEDDSVFSEPPSPVRNGQIASVGVTTRASLAIPDPLRSVHFEDELEKRRSQISNSGKVD